jgi:ethanolamine kinase
MGTNTHPADSIRYIPLSYDNADSHNSALNLILALRPEWKAYKDTVEFVRFTDGITNTVRSLFAPEFVFPKDQSLTKR